MVERGMLEQSMPLMAYVVADTLQRVAQEILDTRQMPLPGPSSTDVSPDYIPNWVLEDRNFHGLDYLHQKGGYIIGFFENLSAPKFTRGFAYYTGETLYRIQYEALKRTRSEKINGKLRAHTYTVAEEKGKIDFQYWCIPEDQIPDVLDLETMGKN